MVRSVCAVRRRVERWCRRACDAQLSQEDTRTGGVHARHFASQLTSLAKKAQAAKDGESRAKAYADLLATCAPCHASVRKE